MSSLAARTREAVDALPFLHDALRAGVVNYTAAARYLDVEGDVDAIATALRRYADELPADEPAESSVRVTMNGGFGETSEGALLRVGDVGYAPDAGSMTVVQASGSLDVGVLREVLGRLAIASIEPRAVGATGDSLVVVVDRRAGPDALRVVERVFEG